MREYRKPCNYTKEDHRIGIWRIYRLQRKFSHLAATSLQIPCQVYLQLGSKLRKAYCQQLPTHLCITGKTVSAQQCTSYVATLANCTFKETKENKNDLKALLGKKYVSHSQLSPSPSQLELQESELKIAIITIFN